MDNEKFKVWCEKATADIRYRPDRKVVYEELMGHLEDAYERNIAQGLSPAAAQLQALESIGCAQEVGSQLAKVHRRIQRIHFGRFCRNHAGTFRQKRNAA